MNEPINIKYHPRIFLACRALIRSPSNKILILQRANDESSFAEKWELPGGKFEEGQDISESLEREVEEETGLKVSAANNLIYLDSHKETTGKYKGYTYVVIIGSIYTENSKVKISYEHKKFKWVNKKEALKYDLVSESRRAIETMA